MLDSIKWWIKWGWLPKGSTVDETDELGEDYWYNPKTDEWRAVRWVRDYLGFKVGTTVKDKKPSWRRDDNG